MTEIPTYTSDVKAAAIEDVDTLRWQMEPKLERVEAAATDKRYSDEGRAEFVGQAAEDAADTLGKWAAETAGALDEVETAAHETLQEARATTPEEMGTAAATLTPVLAAVNQDPEALLRAYENSLEDNATRAILERTIANMIAADIGGLQFSEAWSRLQRRLELPEVEQEALDKLTEISAARGYIDAATHLAQFAIIETAGSQLNGGQLLAKERMRAGMRAYESGVESGWLLRVS